MKKVFVFLLLIGTLDVLCAQVPLLTYGQHVRNYYYGWSGFGPYYDQGIYHFPHSNDDGGNRTWVFDDEYWRLGMQAPMFLQTEYIEGELKVIGIAGAISDRYYENRILNFDPIFDVDDTSRANSPQESFLLYELDSTGVPIFVDSACWTCGSTPHHFMTVTDYRVTPRPNVVPVYEVYFDQPHVVRDSFCVGFTHNRNYFVKRVNQRGDTVLRYAHQPHYYPLSIPFLGDPDRYHKPTTKYYRTRRTDGWLRGWFPPDTVWALNNYAPEILWYYYDDNDTVTWKLMTAHNDSIHARFNRAYHVNMSVRNKVDTLREFSYPLVYPIFDTTGIDVDSLNRLFDEKWCYESCFPLTRMDVYPTPDQKAIITWSGPDDYVSYRLRFVKYGTESVFHKPIIRTDDSHYLANVDSNVWYEAVVNGICDYEKKRDTVADDFVYLAFKLTSEGFQVAYSPEELRAIVYADSSNADTLHQAAILNNGKLENLTFVHPNPTMDKATVFSSYQIRYIDIYSDDSRYMGRVEVHGTQTDLDVSTYPKGAYFLVVNTYRGAVVKKLIVQ